MFIQYNKLVSMSRPIVFLDVDGVLHPFHGHLSQVTTFHAACMNELARIVEAINAEIVLSSSWRNFASTRDKVQANLNQFGMSYSRWIEADSSNKNPSAMKLQKILAFVQAHHPPDWIVLDDEDLIGESGVDPLSMMAQLFASRFVQTNPATGLTGDDAGKAIDIINSR